MADTEIEGYIYGNHAERGWITVKVGLTPKAIRVPTLRKDWVLGEKVLVTVEKMPEREVVMVEPS